MLVNHGTVIVYLQDLVSVTASEMIVSKLPSCPSTIIISISIHTVVRF